MKDLFQKMKLPLIIIVLIGVGFVAYNSLFKKAPDDSALAVNSVEANSDTADFLPLLLQVQDIKFNPGFFNNSIYVSLKDFTQTIVSEQPGRDDPFATALAGETSSNVEGLGFSVQTVSSTTQGTATIKIASSTAQNTNAAVRK